MAWSEDPSMGCEHPNWHAGPWAGARMDLVSLRDMTDIDDWKDITEETFRDLAKYTIEDLPEGCECSLCEKYKLAHEGKVIPGYSPGKEARNYPDIKIESAISGEYVSDTGLGRTKPMTDQNREYSQPRNELSSFEKMPFEIMEILFSYVDRESLPNCVYLSSRIYPAAIKRLYYRVQLISDSSTRNFAQTLISRPIVKDYVRQLLTVIDPHWESVSVLHTILRQLPFLTLLEIGPSWVTYGDFPYWEYPFKLQGLKWGLIKDEAANKFIDSQSNLTSDVVYWGLPP
jgi:hypothetical protein